MSNLIVYLISGVVAGAIYSVYASGLTLVRSATGIYYLALGSFAFIADLFFYEVTTESMPRWAAFLLTIFVVAPVLGLALEGLVFRRLARVPEAPRLIATVGLLLALPAIGTELVKLLTTQFHLNLASIDAAYSIPGIGPEPPKTFNILGRGALTSDQLLLVLVSAVAVFAMWLLLTRTRLGLMTRAVVDQSALASTRGINPAYTSRVAWVLGSVLAAIAGIMAGPIFGLSVDAALELVIAASAVVVIARFRSLPLAMIGGLGLGAVSALFAGYGSDVPGLNSLLNTIPGTRASVIYIVLLVAVLVRGREKGRVAGISEIADPTPENYAAGLPAWRRAWPWVLLVGVLLLWGCDVIPWSHVQAGGLEQTLLIQALGLAMVFLSFNVVVGQLGVASLAQAAMVTTGALMAGFVVHQGFLGGNFIVAVLAASFGAAVLGIIVALPAFRLGGLALALATLAIGYMCDQIIFQINQFNNFNSGWTLSRPKFGVFDFTGNNAFILLLTAFFLVAMWVVTNVRRSATGRAIIAVRFAPTAALASGISMRRTIVTAFAISGFLAGLGGALLAYGAGTIAPNNWPTETGLLWLMIAILQGVRQPAAALLGGILAVFTGRVLQIGFWGLIPPVNDPAIPTILFGVACIMLANQPDGVVQQMSQAAGRVRARVRGRQHDRPARTVAPDSALGAAVADGAAGGSLSPQPNGTAPVRSTALEASAPAAKQQSAGSDLAPDAILHVRGLVAGYGDARVLHGVDLIVPRATIVAVLGPNGAGKSTLCGAIAGTVTSSAGSIVLNGADVSRLPAHQRAGAGLMIAPESRGIFPRLSVEENLEILLPSKDDREQAFARFPQLGDRRKLQASFLSGGEQQMLCLAPIIVKPPALLIADEIGLGLARTVTAKVMEVLSELRDSGVSILMVEERAANILRLADKVAFLSSGVVIRDGPVSDFTEEVAAEAYLGPSVKS